MLKNIELNNIYNLMHTSWKAQKLICLSDIFCNFFFLMTIDGESRFSIQNILFSSKVLTINIDKTKAAYGTLWLSLLI